MQYNSGEIIRLKDSGNDEFLIVLTKESIEHKDLLKECDYVVKSVTNDTIKYVFEADVYKLPAK